MADRIPTRYVEMEFHEYECPYWRLGKSHGPCTCPKETNMSFKIGDQVSWASQANGRTVVKKGAIYEIVAPGADPTGIKGAGMPRDHESYVVKAFKETDRKRTALYWPIVSKLHREYERFDEAALRQEIAKTWGEHGAHADLFGMMMDRIEAGRKWEAIVHEELRSAKAGGDPIAIQMAEWGVKLVTAINAGRGPDAAPKTWAGHPGEAG
jgi:hypothetical protein